MNLFSKIYWRIFKKYRLSLRQEINQNNMANLNNRDFSLISSNCNGAVLLHDLNLQFRTPTVNLWFEPADYIEFLRNLEKYLHTDLVFSSELEEKCQYPVGILGQKVKVYFQHYKTRQEARLKWEERSKRVNMNNLFIIFTDRDGCTYQNIKDFDSLPYKNKVIFTHIPYPEFKSAYYIKGFENDGCVGVCFDFKKATTGIKYYDDFPYIRWFNGESTFG